MEITPDKKRLLTLVEQAAEGAIVLPQFQRNFVWSRDDITDLLASILKGYFIGSFLLLRTDPDDSPFAFRLIAGAKKAPDGLRPEWLILDGQQRLTSLHYVFEAPSIPLKWTKYPYKFFLDLKKVREGDLDGALFSERADLCGQYMAPGYQFQELIVPFSQLPHWENWLNSYERWLIDRDKDRYFEDYFPNAKPAWNNIIGRLREFIVPTIEIPKVRSDDADRIAEVCAIFEKMNSTGVSLTVYDLLTARLYRYGIDLHELWQEACEEHDLLTEFSGKERDPDPYGLFALRVIALMRGLDVKSRTLINLSPAGFAAEWRTAAEYIEKALERVTSTSTDGFGAFDAKWLPYSTMVPVLAALLQRIETKHLGARAFAGLRRWYWASVFLEGYAGAVESTTAADYRDMVKWFDDPSHLAEVFQRADRNILDNPGYSLRGTARINSIYKGVMNLVAIRGAKDFQADDAIEFHVLDDHHIFPLAFLNKQKAAGSLPDLTAIEMNSIVNKTLISAQTNRRISRRSPSEYLKALVPPDRKANILTSHFIDPCAAEAMECDDYPQFLGARENALIAEIRRVVAKVWN